MKQAIRRRDWIRWPAALALVAGTHALAAKERPMVQVGAPLPLADMPLLDGTLFRAAEMQQQVLVVYWWASWCPFCAIQTPYVQKLWDTQRARGLKMLTLSIDQREEAARKYMADRGYTFPAAHVGTQAGHPWSKPGKGLPVTCVRGRDGRLLLAEAGQLFPEDVEQIARFL